MKITEISIRNFRRLEDITIDIEDRETVFVGPNNSGKTSATAAFRCFLGGKDFSIHDLSVGRIGDMDAFAENHEGKTPPSIELDIWFTVDPSSIEFGRAFPLLPRLSDKYDRLGVRLRYAPSDPAKLLQDYRNAYPEDGSQDEAKSLSQYLSIDENFKRFFALSYYSLEHTDDKVAETLLKPDEGKSLLRSLIRVDFVDAQRNIDDNESHRSHRLSTAFAAFYRKNLEVAEAAAEAHAVIDQNNQQLTEHYGQQFGAIMRMIEALGVPSINDRHLRIVSSLSPLTALQGNTELLYVDQARNHELPELYNGLGFKNLIYMAIQVKHFHLQWIRTPEIRPLTQLIFIEEPEVHLHAQVQQTFIANIWQIIAKSSEENGEGALVPQLVITTHSSHILDTVDFEKVRYFRRCASADPSEPPGVLSLTEVHSLRSFKPDAAGVENQDGNGDYEAATDHTPPEDEEAAKKRALDFLKRYLRLTHCDLFFADAVILVEGAVEKLLFPAMIEKAAPGLRSSYLTTLEVGGAYAHRFESLLEFLHIPYLLVTDLDSVQAEGRHPACRADTEGAITSNMSLRRFLGKSTVADLVALEGEAKQSLEKDRCIAFQIDIPVEERGSELSMRPRSFEESFAYQNLELLRSGDLNLGVDIPEDLNEAYQTIYDRTRSSDFKKTDFAMAVLAGTQDWSPPNYIAEGLQWLEKRLNPRSSSN